MSVQRPWFRQPMVWLLILFPATAVVAGMVTIWLAIASDDGLVADDYYWQGKQINRTLARDATARDFGLAARVALVPAGGSLSTQLTARYTIEYPDTLVLDFLHATRAGQDRQVALRHLGSGLFEGGMPALAAGHWHLQLGTPQWRIGGRVYLPGAETLELLPAAD